jgi:hypothetical protein
VIVLIADSFNFTPKSILGSLPVGVVDFSRCKFTAKHATLAPPARTGEGAKKILCGLRALRGSSENRAVEEDHPTLKSRYVLRGKLPLMKTHSATALAHPNIAFIKFTLA